MVYDSNEAKEIPISPQKVFDSLEDVHPALKLKKGLTTINNKLTNQNLMPSAT